jgi:hypothetical protein
MRVAMITMSVGMAALLCSGCDPVTMGVTAGAGLAANALFGDSKMVVRNIGWYSFYPLPDGRSVAAESGKSLVVIEYEIANPGDRDVLVNPERALLTDADGKIAQETAGIGGLRTGKLSPDDDALLHGNETWQMLSVFEVPPGEYAVLVPSGRTAEEPNPHRLTGCRFPGPIAQR